MKEKGADKEDLTGMLRKWGKACFICDIQGAWLPGRKHVSLQASSCQVPSIVSTRIGSTSSAWPASDSDWTPPRRSDARSRKRSFEQLSAWGPRPGEKPSEVEAEHMQIMSGCPPDNFFRAFHGVQVLHLPRRRTYCAFNALRSCRFVRRLCGRC